LPSESIYLDCLKLNVMAVSLAIRGKWLSNDDVAASYDRAAASYDDSWLAQLRETTDRFLDLLPAPPADKPILDLGCGTGYTTRRLSAMFPQHAIAAVDISTEMLARAREKIHSARVELTCVDMLEFLRRQPDRNAAMITSAWAIGYSQPAKVIAEAGRVLPENGLLGFVVNYRDTLQPIFLSFRKCMARFASSLQKIALPQFPRDFAAINNMLARGGFEVVSQEDGYQSIRKPPAEQNYLQWMLKTGVLAGFDSMLPLKENGPVADYFEQLLHDSRLPFDHHYVIVIARRK
jgi:ubiquinone/menaquinone biosynthesis C-methylase UbiE